MEKEFVPYELAVKLKVLGFDEPCFGYYDGNHNLQFMYNGIPEKFTEKRMGPADSVWVGWISAPTYSQCFRWFREKHNIDGLLHKTAEGSYYFWITECEYENYNHYKYYNQMVYFNTYEEAELACLERLIELVESKSE